MSKEYKPGGRLIIGSTGHIDGHKIKILGSFYFSGHVVYKVKFYPLKFKSSVVHQPEPWIEFLTKKSIGNYQGPY